MPSLTVGEPGRTIRLGVRHSRLVVALVFEAVGTTVDVTADPAVACETTGVDFKDELDDFCCAHRLWRPATTVNTVDTDVVRAMTGAGFPVLGAAYDAGAATCAPVPRWACGPLRRFRAHEAARHAFGPKATRAVVRALAGALSRSRVDALALGL